MKKFILVFCIIGSALFSAHSDELWQEDDLDLGSGFVSVEGGWLRVLGRGRNQVEDSVMLGISTGISLSKEFKAESDFEPLKIGPKIAVGFGKVKSTNELEIFYDILLKVRYYFFPYSWWLRTYLDAGPGLFTYGKKSFEVEAGAGIEAYAGSSILGVNLQYKRVIKSPFVGQGLTFLASLGYRF